MTGRGMAYQLFTRGLIENMGDKCVRNVSRTLVIAREREIGATVGGIVRPILDEFAVSFQVLHGFGSATSLHSVAEESLRGERYLEILYIGDCDPSGMHMSEVDLPGRVERYGGAVDVTRIALTASDCTDALPSFNVATKQKDHRYRWFRQNYGQRCWELDAMNPNALRERVHDAILSRIDIDAWVHCQTVEKAERESAP
jgi:hypothetical protein